MTTDDEIYREIVDSHPDDLITIYRYIAWVKFRRTMHNQFYFRAHWVAPAVQYHWVGNYDRMDSRAF
jgi:hypothetical protein